MNSTFWATFVILVATYGSLPKEVRGKEKKSAENEKLFTYQDMAEKALCDVLKQGSFTKTSCVTKRAMEEIRKAVAEVDFDKATKRHLDSEWMNNNHQHLQKMFSQIVNQTKMKQFSEARTTLGKALHDLQEFYFYTNGLELRQKGVIKNLGIPDFQNKSICSDCKNRRKRELGAAISGMQNVRGINNAAPNTGTNQPAGQLPEGPCPVVVVLKRTKELIKKSIKRVKLRRRRQVQKVILSPHFPEENGKMAHEASKYWLGQLLKEFNDDGITELFEVLKDETLIDCACH